MPTESSSAPPFVAITGATGLIGRAIVARLRLDGRRVRRLVRSARPDDPDDIVWDPKRGVLDPRDLEGAEAVIHLAGEPIGQRWTGSRREAIRESRVRGTELLARAIAALDRRPGVLLSGSAVGIYGDRGDEAVDEESATGTDFLAGVAREWEGATAAAKEAGVRVVLLRSGVVLSPHGGALERLLPPFRLGVGGPIGTGRQFMSWIALDDHLNAMEHALATTGLHGPVNLVSPNPVTNAEFAATLGRVLGRPALVPVPSFALELLYGEMARATILAGQRVLPRALLRAGFKFAHPTLEEALRFELAR
ncbi:MAG TPA: TIGR01777 family oxidoreductase [Gemmatimonadaceae bacterium]|nr:TIGR01777 family oxidoreductase [Gemmatimonadaceae bacterium]